MPISSEFTISLEDPVSQDVNISFDVIINLKNGSTYTQPVSGVIKAGQSSTVVKINIPSLDYDDIEEKAQIVNTVVTPPDFDLIIETVYFRKPPPPPPPPPPPAPPSPAPPSPGAGSTPLLRKAVEDQVNMIHANNEPPSALCAGYSFSFAIKIKEHIDTKSPKAIYHKQSGGGHAHEPGLRKNILNLGIYEQEYLGEMTAINLKKLINTIPWNYGELLQYYAVAPGTDRWIDPGNGGNRHLQMYIGDIQPQKKGVKRNLKPGKTFFKGYSGWTTDEPNNYGTAFVYSTSSKTGADKIIFRAYRFKIKASYLK